MTEDQKFIDAVVPHIAQGILSNEFETLELFGTKKKKHEAIEDFTNFVFDIAEALLKKRKERLKDDNLT